MTAPETLPSVPAGAAAAASLYWREGLHPIPVCRPDRTSAWGCACRWHRMLPDHASRGAGKTPLLRSAELRQALEHGVTAAGVAAMPWRTANVALCLEPAALVVLDLDGPEAAAEAAGRGLPPTATVARGDHAHWYYRLPAGVPAGRAIKQGRSGSIDVLAAGYVVAPPSLHHSGRPYLVLSAAPFAPLPDWAAASLVAAAERQRDAAPLGPAAAASDEALAGLRSARVPAWVLERIRSGDRSGDRSRTDWAVTRAMVEHGLPDAVIAAIYRNPGFRIGAKYRERRDPDRYLAALLARHHAEVLRPAPGPGLQR